MLQDTLNDMLRMTAKLIHEAFCLPCWEVISSTNFTLARHTGHSLPFPSEAGKKKVNTTSQTYH